MLTKIILLVLGLHDGTVPVPRTAAPVKVVTSLTTYAAIATEIVGDRGKVSSIAVGDENPHYVQPKPSFVPTLAQADLFVTTGLDLELWCRRCSTRRTMRRSPKGGRDTLRRIRACRCSTFRQPVALPRRHHVYGNPHIWTDPLNAVLIARNILRGLKRVAPQDADYFTAREKDFEDRLYRALFGADLVKLIGGETLADLDRQASSSISSGSSNTRALR